MKKVLFTLQWYGIPANLAASANALCDETIIELLKKDKSLEIHVLSYGLSGYPLEETIEGVFVHRVQRSKIWDAFIHTRNKDKTLRSRIIYFTNRVLMRFKQLLFFYSFPNYEPFHVNRFSRAAVELHKKYDFDLVVSEFNGVDSLYAGFSVKQYDSTVLYLPICWDSISGGRLVKWMPAIMCRKFRRNMESQIMELADRAIVMESSRKFHESFTTSYNYYKKFKYLDVPYLSVPERQMRVAVDNRIKLEEQLTILYSGTMADRNPEYLLRVFDNLGCKVRALFITPVQYHAKIRAIQDNLQNVIIECLPYMAHGELAIHQKNSDVLLNFGVSNANAVSGKIFDYMRLGKPIISTFNHDNEACIPYLLRYPQACMIDERKDIMQSAEEVKRFITYVNSSSVDMGTVKTLFEDNTPEAYIKEINSLLVNG